MPIKKQFPSHRARVMFRPKATEDVLLAAINNVEKQFLLAVDRLTAIAREDPEAPSLDWTIHELCRHATNTYDRLAVLVEEDRKRKKR